MKRVLALALLGLMFMTVIAACGSSQGHCDAYGKATVQMEYADLADA